MSENPAPSTLGLTCAEAARRAAAGRANVTDQRGTGRSTWQIIRANVFTRVNAILGVLCAIVLATGSIVNAAFGLLIIANSAVGIIQELRARHTLAQLRIVGQAQPVVIRDGQPRRIPQEEVVEGDLIQVGSGDEIIVDGTVVAAPPGGGLAVDESQLTGESTAVRKHPGDEVLSGSFVASGAGRYRAVRVGKHAYAARLAHEAAEFTLTDSQLMSGINAILRVIQWLLIPTGILTVFTQLVRSGTGLRDAVLAMTAAIVPMVPEGLVLMTSIAFAAGVIRLGRRRALVNELVAVEGLARVDTVCTDKTGTLTTNAMELDSVLLADAATPAPADARAALASLVTSQSDRNATAEAILAGLGPGERWQGEEIAFTSREKYSGFRRADGQTWLLGAPEVLLREAAEGAGAGRLESRGLRVLAFGPASAAVADKPRLERAFVVVLRQQLRPDARETLDFFARENVDLKIISGDNPASVRAVAGGATDRELVAVDARELTGLGREEFDAEIARANVFGRVTPAQKRQMVEALQRAGHTVAMTGDGVNDVLALKKADIGVAMGSGAPATRSVAQLVLLTDRFSALPHVVAEGRRVIGNIERVANLFLTKTVYSVVLALVVAIFGVAFPFQPIHVTITGWFTIGIPAFILSLAPNTERPRDGFVRRVLLLALPSGLLVGGLSAAMWLAIYPGPQASALERDRAGTAVLLALIIMGLWVLGIVARPWNWWKVALLAGCVAGYVVIFAVTPIRRIVLLAPGDVGLMALGVLVGLVGAALIEVAHRVASTVGAKGKRWWSARDRGATQR